MFLFHSSNLIFFPYSFLPFHPSFSYSDLHRFNLLSLSRKATIIHTSHSLPLVSFLLSFPPLLSFPFYCWCVAFLFSSFPFFCPCFPPSTSNIPSLISPFHSPSSPFSYLTIFFPPFSFPSLSFYLPFPLSCHILTLAHALFYHSLLPFLPNLLFSSLLHLAFFYVLLPPSSSLSLPLPLSFLFSSFPFHTFPSSSVSLFLPLSSFAVTLYSSFLHLYSL